MDEREANIDIVFRNGFKDFEMLPPPEVWDNIQPVIRRKRKPFILLRIAAVVAIILSISFLIYNWNREIPVVSENQILPVNGESVPLMQNPSPIINSQLIGTGNRKIASQKRKLIEETNMVTMRPDDETIITPVPEISAKSDLLASKGNLSLAGQTRNIISGQNTGISFIQNLTTNNHSEIEPLKVTQRWSIAAMASPTYFSQFNSGKDDLSRQMMASEQPLVSYSGGVALSYKVSKKISIQSGLYYSSVGQEVDGISSFGGFQQFNFTKGARNFEVLTSSGLIYTSNSDVFLTDGIGDRVQTQITRDVFDPEKASLQYLNNSLKQNFSYLELPFVVRYKLIDRSLDLNVIGGVSYNFLVNNSVYATNDGNRYPIGKTEGLSIMTFSSSIGMGMEYCFTKSFSLNLEPTFRYYLNPFNGLPETNIHPYSFGIFSGISYKF